MKLSVCDFAKLSCKCSLGTTSQTGRRLGSLALSLATLLHFTAIDLRAAGVVTNCTDQAFRSAIAGGGAINFTGTCSITLTGSVSIVANTTIDTGGNIVTLSGGDSVRLFTVASNINLALTGLTLSNGRSTNGGAIFINTNATVQLTNCILTANNAIGVAGIAGNNGQTNAGVGLNGGGSGAGGSSFGGAIYNLGSVVMQRCIVSTNTVIGGAGGSGGKGGDGELGGGRGGSGSTGGTGFGGSIYNLGILSARDCTFSNSVAVGGAGGAGGLGGYGPTPGLNGTGAAGGIGSGAAIFSAQSVALVNCTFSDNQSRGGSSGGGGTLGNGCGVNGLRGADGFGGGVHNIGSAFATNCTFYNNKVTGGSGGYGGYGDVFYGGNGGNGGDGNGGSFYNAGSVTLVNTTFSHGSATGGTNGLAGVGVFQNGVNGATGLSLGGNIARGSGTFTIKNTILATNLSGGSVYGTVTDAGNNICADGSVALGGSSFVNTDPKLGGFADNGGPTKTLLPLPISPAIDTGNDTAALLFDQRGFVRPRGAHVDIGSVEATPPSIDSISTSAINFSFSYQTVVGSTYVVQTKTNLNESAWTSIATNLGTGSLTNFSTIKSNAGNKFFRLLVQ